MLIACGLVLRHRSDPSSLVVQQIDFSSIEVQVHAKTAEILERSLRAAPHPINPSDAFLANLATQRNQAALMLVHRADDLLARNEPVAATKTLRQAVALFPETSAALRANRQLEQLESRS